jgi:hypothetical protein
VIIVMGSRSEIKTVVIRQQDGEVITPWADIKDLRGFEWIRDAPDVVVPETREILEATYVDVQKVPIIIMGEKTKVSINGGPPQDEYEVAVFQSDIDGKVYDVSKRCADKRKVKLYDKVTLHLLGCCNIMNIKKVRVKKKGKNKKKEEE